MSHQDRRHRATSPASLEAVFAWLLPSDFQFVRHGNACIEPVILIAQAIATWGWAAGRTLSGRLDTATAAIRRIFPGQRVATRQGLCQALATCGDELVGQLRARIADRLQNLKGYWRTAGRPTFAIDGSKFAAPRTAANQQAFAALAGDASSANYDDPAAASKANTVQLLLTMFWHIGSGLPINWRLAPSTGSERNLAIEMLDELPPDARVVADAEYVGYPLWSAIVESRRAFAIRIGSNITLLKKLEVRCRTEVVYFWPQRARQQGQPPLVLRLVPVQGPRSVVWLLTNEFDLADQQIAELYLARWGIEVFFRTVKQSCGKAKLLCRTPDNVRTELQWTLLGIWISLFVAKQRFREQGLSLRSLSPVQVMDAFAHALMITAYSDSATQALLHLYSCQKADESHRTTGKASRNYPRKKRHTSCGPPKIRLATKEEQRRAKQFL